LIGLIDIDGKLPNLALMKISSYYKSMGEQVEFIKEGKKYTKIYASCLFTWNRNKCMELIKEHGDKLILGGTGWDFIEIDRKLVEVTHTELPMDIEKCAPDYDLYTVDMVYEKACKGGIASKESKLNKSKVIVDMGLGFTSRGCIRSCGFCIVKQKEGCLHKVGEIKDLINPRSSIITLYDNNLTADPDCVDKLYEIRDRKLKVNISQGIDVRLLTEEKAKALGEVQHLRSLHYAWDLMESENKIIEGIKLLKGFVKEWRHMCFILTGFNTSFEEDMYRIIKLKELGIKPYVMKYNKRNDDIRLNQLAGWINSRKHTCCKFEEFTPWINSKADYYQINMFGGAI
jgi:hypothetical protein